MRQKVDDDSIDLIFTSPPFALLRKKDYGNVEEHKYVSWFKEFGREFYRILKPSGSFILDIGGSWIPGQPTRSLYHFDLLIMLCRELQFHLAQEFYWWSPSKLPTPAEWVTVRRVRVKDAVNCVFWLSKTPFPKASNRRVLAPYSESMVGLLKNGYKAKLRPSGHDISEKFQKNNGAAIPPNLVAIPNTESNSAYLRFCRKNNIKPHPARFPARLPEFFIRMLTDVGDTVLDPFAGSCVTGEVCERLQRTWICCEIDEIYIEGALGRFKHKNDENNKKNDVESYTIYNPSSRWNGVETDDRLPEDGGMKRPLSREVFDTVPEEALDTVEEKEVKSSLPNASQFSPVQTPLPALLQTVKSGEPHRQKVKQDIADAFFADRRDALDLADNTIIAMSEYGLPYKPKDDQTHVSLTELGQSLAKKADSGQLNEMYSEFAKHILINLHGLDLLTCVETLLLQVEHQQKL
jgi:site-specific DNA-methyltransferase (cytosine-N4-specific)